MKIIIIPNDPVWRGRHLCLANTLAEQGHEVHYFMWALPYNMKPAELLKHLFTSLLPKNYIHKQFNVHTAQRLPYFWPYLNGWLFKRQLRKLYQKLDADLIVTESFTNETEVPKDLPFIYDLADDYAAPADVYGGFVYKLAFKLLDVRGVMKRQCKNALAVTVVSEILYNFAKQYSENVNKLPNGVDRDIIQSVIKDKSTYSKNKHSIVYVTNFGQWSRAIETLAAVKKLRKDFPDIDLTLIGPGVEADNIRDFIKTNKTEDYMHYLGPILDRPRLFAFINQSTIGLNISDKNKWRDAACPIKVLEYSALSKKVVSTELAEVKNFNFPNILLFSDKNKNDNLEAALRRALEDKKNYKAVGEKVLRDYSWEELTNDLIEIAKSSRSKRLEVVHVTPAYPPDLGGLEKVVEAVARNQSRLGIKVSVITSTTRRAATFDSNTEITIPITRLKTWAIANTRVMPGLIFKLLKLKRTSVIHLHITQAYMPEIVYLASRLRGLNYVAQVHYHFGARSSKLGIFLTFHERYILSHVLKRASKVIVMTSDYKNLIHDKYGIPGSRIVLIPNATELPIADSPRLQANDTLRLLSVGRLSAQKNTSFLLEALSFYNKTFNQPFRLNIVGDGDQEVFLKSYIKVLGLDKFVMLKGRVSDEVLESIYEESDILLSASMHESFGIVFVEAMAKGLPIVSTDIPAIRDVVQDNKNGLLVRPTVKTFADAIHELAINKELFKTISANNLRDAKKYSWSETCEKLTEVYLRTL